MAKEPTPRYMSATAAARYLGMSKMTFLKYVRAGLFPQAIKLTDTLFRWDRVLIDEVMDSLQPKNEEGEQGETEADN